jgi:hypothetical protein
MDKRAKFKAGLSFGIFMTVFFILKEFFTQDDLTIKRVLINIFSSCLGGAIAGLLFGWLSGLFSKSKMVTETTKIDIDAEEKILFETPANHFKGIEGVGGKLYLTNKRLIFKSHKLNIQNHQLIINSSDIKHVDRYKTLGLVNNGLSITTIADKTERVVVEKVEEWLKILTEKNGLQQGVWQNAG